MALPFRNPAPPNDAPARFVYLVDEFNWGMPSGAAIAALVLMAGFLLNMCAEAADLNSNPYYFVGFLFVNLAVQAWFWRSDHVSKRVHFAVQQRRLTVTRGGMILFQGPFETLRHIFAEERMEQHDAEEGPGKGNPYPVSRLVLVLADGTRTFLSEKSVESTANTEWLRKIRTFLAQQGWPPH